MTIADPSTSSTAGDGSIASLIKALIQQVRTLLRQELTLARAEVSESVGQVGTAVAMMAVGAILGLAALVVLLFAAVYGLGLVLPMWASALIVGAVVALIALFLVLRGKNNLAARNLMPRRTARTLAEDVRLAKDKL